MSCSVKWLHSMPAFCFLVFGFIKQEVPKYSRACRPKNISYYEGGENTLIESVLLESNTLSHYIRSKGIVLR